MDGKTEKEKIALRNVFFLDTVLVGKFENKSLGVKSETKIVFAKLSLQGLDT